MTKQIIEINGVKMEVDMRHARRVDELRVGDRVKVMTKKYDGYSVFAGTIIGFEPFQKLPTIIVAYIEVSYGTGGDIKFVHYNAQSKDVEIIKAIDDDSLDLSKADALRSFEAQIGKKHEEIAELQRKRDYFLNHFQAYWAPMAEPSLPNGDPTTVPADPF